jgi:hypothetical protein
MDHSYYHLHRGTHGYRQYENLNKRHHLKRQGFPLRAGAGGGGGRWGGVITQHCTIYVDLQYYIYKTYQGCLCCINIFKTGAKANLNKKRHDC